MTLPMVSSAPMNSSTVVVPGPDDLAIATSPELKHSILTDFSPPRTIVTPPSGQAMTCRGLLFRIDSPSRTRAAQNFDDALGTGASQPSQPGRNASNWTSSGRG